MNTPILKKFKCVVSISMLPVQYTRQVSWYFRINDIFLIFELVHLTILSNTENKLNILTRTKEKIPMQFVTRKYLSYSKRKEEVNMVGPSSNQWCSCSAD